MSVDLLKLMGMNKIQQMYMYVLVLGYAPKEEWQMLNQQEYFTPKNGWWEITWDSKS